MRRTSPIIGAICILVFSAHATAHQRHVPSEYPTIQAAIDAAYGGDEVIIADGIYTGEGNRDIYFAGKAVTVRSESGPEMCIIDCNATPADPHVGFYLSSDATLTGLTVINGCHERGAAVYCYARYDRTDPRIISCIFRDNSAEEGGAIYCNRDTSLTITNCTFSNNSAEKLGGAIYCDQAALTLLSCAFDRNSAEQDGGGIYFSQASSAIIDDCVISKNAANATASELRGGGLYCSGASISILNSKISGNSAALGGGIYCDPYHGPTKLYISNSHIIANVANRSYDWYDGEGGGIYYYGLWWRDSGSFIILNSTISDNKAQGGWSSGGAIYCYSSAPIVSNCKLNGNSADFGPAMFCLQSRLNINGCVIAGNASYEKPTFHNGSIALVKSESGIMSNCTVVRNSPSAASGVGIITNSILYYNGYDANHPEQIRSPGYDVRYSNVQGSYEGIGNIDADPCFLDAGAGYWDANGTPGDREDDFWVWTEGDYHLSPTSPCIGAGDPNYITGFRDTDLDGNPRVVGTVVDMGAYEFGQSRIEGEMKLAPEMLNCGSKGKFVKAHMILPEEILAGDIDVNEPAVAGPMGIESEYIRLVGGNTGPVKLEIAFDRRAFCEALTETGEVEVTVTGLLTTGQAFYGTDTIRIVGRERKLTLRRRVGR